MSPGGSKRGVDGDDGLPISALRCNSNVTNIIPAKIATLK